MLKLSIITVNLNNAEGLRKTIESVVNQTYTHFEHIIIDGGSTDGSVDVIKEYENRYTHIEGGLYWVSEPDKGIYNGMNKGIKVAKGEYCYFLNSGDYLVNHTVINLITSKSNKQDLIYGNFVKKLDNGKFIKRTQPEKLSLSTFFTTSITQQATLINKKLFHRIGLYDERYSIVSDWKFFMEAILLDDLTYQYIDYDFAYFQEGGISNNPTFHNKHMMERDQVFKELKLPTCVKNDMGELIRLQIFEQDIKSRHLIIPAIKIENFIRMAKKKILFR